jgi:hypothetical protein
VGLGFLWGIDSNLFISLNAGCARFSGLAFLPHKDSHRVEGDKLVTMKYKDSIAPWLALAVATSALLNSAGNNECPINDQCMSLLPSPESGGEHVPEGGNNGNVAWGSSQSAIGFGGNNNSYPQLPLVWANNNNWWG